jgi:hypothetical protein
MHQIKLERILVAHGHLEVGCYMRRHLVHVHFPPDGLTREQQHRQALEQVVYL